MKKLYILAGAIFVCCALLAHPVFAQDRKPPLIGILWVGDVKNSAPYLNPLLESLRKLGWVDGKTAKFILRFDGEDRSKLPALAKELVALKVDVLVATDSALLAAKQATSTIPIVCPDLFDPIEEGVSNSLAKPNQNITGFSFQSLDIAAKRVEFAKEILPTLKTIGLIYDTTEPGTHMEMKGFAEGARRSVASLKKYALRGPDDFDSVFAAIRKDRPDVLMISATPLTVFRFDKLARFALDARLPTFSEIPEFASAGGLLTYGVRIADAFASAAEQVNRILKGAKPSELPFLQPTKFELVVNLKTAKVLGIKIPESLMLRATEVIR